MKFLKNRIFLAAACLILAAALVFVAVPMAASPSEPAPTVEPSAEPSDPPRRTPPSGYCFVSVTAQSLASAVAGHVAPGDRVNVFAQSVNEDGTQTVAVLLSNVEVVSVRNNTNDDVDTSEDATPRTVTLLVNVEQAAQIVATERSGGVYLALVGGDA